MKVKKNSVTSFWEYNKKYNKAMEPIIKELFQAEEIGQLGYIPVNKIDESQNRFSAGPKQEKLEVKIKKQILGDYENSIVNSIYHGNYTTTILAGAMGSGKTATGSKILQYLQEMRTNPCGKCVFAKMNFNEGFPSKNVSNILVTFNQKLLDLLKYEILKILSNNDRADKFVDDLKSDKLGVKFAGFMDLPRTITKLATNWENFEQVEKVYVIFDFIENKFNIIELRIEILMLIFYYIKNYCICELSCFVIFYDNIDRLPPEAQYHILKSILSYHEVSEVKTLVSMRRSTYKRFEDRSSYSTNYIHHSGPTPLRIIKLRIKNILNNFEDNRNTLFKDINIEYVESLKQRLEFLDGLLEDNDVASVIEGLSGASIRLGLLLITRAFLNNVCNYNKNPANRWMIPRAIFTSNSEDLTVDNNDELLANVLINPKTQMFSFIQIRVLQYIFAQRQNGKSRKFSDIHEALDALSNYGDDDFLFAINYMLNVKRPLIWVEGKSNYKTFSQLIECNDEISLTEIGEGYLRRILGNINYIQDAMCSTVWPNREVPNSMDDNNFFNRSIFVRFCFKHMMKIDYIECLRFKNWLKIRNRELNDYNLNMITSVMMSKLGSVVMNFIGSNDSFDEKQEAENWYAMMLTSFDNNNTISGLYMKSLDQLLKKFRRR